MELHETGLVGLADALTRGEVSPREAADHFLARIERLDTPSGSPGDDRGLGAFVEVTGDRARERADALGDPDPAEALWGIPLADKDLVARAGVPTRYGSRAFSDNVPAASDPLAVALDRAGAVSLGKTSTPEFGVTGYTEPVAGRAARNPWDVATGAGGSSGGAAVAVAAGLLPAAPASDGGGSIRIPAATVGVVGLKPSRGLLSYGADDGPLGGLATAGPIARTVVDAAFLLDALAPGRTSFLDAARCDPGALRVGITLATPWDGWTDTTLDPAARAAYDAAAALLASSGASVDALDWRPRGYPELFLAIWRASAARIPLADERLDELEPLTAWLVREGRAQEPGSLRVVLAAARAFERETIAAFAPYDVVLTPALAQSPRPLGWYDAQDPARNFAQQCSYAPHTSFVNVCGLPAITVPVRPDGTGRPVSVQLIGRPGGDAALVSVAARLEALRGPLPWPPIAARGRGRRIR